MRRADLEPRAHLHVCTHERPADDPLGPGCGARGVAVFSALSRARTARGLTREIWLAKGSCLGQCPRRGCTVALGGAAGVAHFVEVEPADADELLRVSAAR